MKKVFIFMGASALVLSSCSQEDVLSVNNNANVDNAISFHVRSHKQSRSLEYSSYNLDDFMVFGFKGDPDEGETVIDYFAEGKPVKFTREEGGLLFNSETPYYYPTDGSWLYFAAYAPSTLEMTKFGQFGGITCDFTVDSDITKQIDIISATGGSNLEKDEPDQELTFQHALTKVYISEIRNSDSRHKYEIMGVKFGNIHNSGKYEYRGEKAYDGDETPNGTFREDGFIQDAIGYGIFWQPTGEQTGDMEYTFSSPIVLDSNATSAELMKGSDTDSDTKAESFMLMPQQLSKAFLNAEGNLGGLEFDKGMSYIAFLVRITNTITGDVIYPYAKDEYGNSTVDAISKTIDGVTYAWAAFPISSIWAPGTYVDYLVDFSEGAGFVAPGASEEVELQPILGRKIKFYVEVDNWGESEDGSSTGQGQWITVGQDSELGVDVAGEDDPFGDD